MIIFKKFSFYVSIAGIILAIILVRIIQTPAPGREFARASAANPYPSTIATSGIIESSDRNIAIGAPQAGIVAKVYVKVSDQVKEGQPLFQIDPRELQAKILTQEANVKVSEANLIRLKDQLARLRSVSDPRAVSQEDVRTRENDVLVADMQVLAAKAQVEETQRLIERLTVHAPNNGTMLQSNIRVGEYVAANADSPVMLFGTSNSLQVRVDIDEQNASRFHPGFRAIAYLKNNTQTSFPLEFDRIEPYIIPKKSLTGASDERVDTRVLQVIYAFNRPIDLNVFVGQQVDVFIEDTKK
ncbi:MAG: efflux RND transporter periplasmic adaptor subunit [Parachlamydiaceae bacterium]|nr:efflux RND transporter periplasmic adaptor subunit [Parachlamydiaceae bacterium]